METANILEFKNIDVGIDTGPSYDVLLSESSSAKKIANIQGRTNTVGYACIGMAESYRRLGKISSALEEQDNALTYFIETNNQAGLAWANWNGANISRQQGDYEKSITQLKRAIYYSGPSKEIDCEQYSIAGLAESTRILGDYESSYSQHLHAYKLFFNRRDYRGIVWAYEGIAQILKNTGNVEQATRLFAEAVKLSKEISDYRGLGYALKCFGECLALRGNYLDGLRHLHESESMFRGIQHKTGLAYALKATADTYRDNFLHDEALNMYAKAEAIFSEIGEDRGLAYVAVSRGVLALKIGNSIDAYEHFNNSKKVFQKRNIKFGITLIKRSLKEDRKDWNDLRHLLFYQHNRKAEQSHALGQ